MNYVFDIDGTICTQSNPDYSNAEPFLERIEQINRLYDDGNIIIFQTARGMGRSNNNQKIAIELMYEFTKKQLDDWGVKYHNIFLGKPAGDVYVDDKGIRDEDFFTEGPKKGAIMSDKESNRKYLPTLSELIDRLSITQLKEVFIIDHKEEYSQEIKDICHDIQVILNGSNKITSEAIRAIVVLSQMNLHIWHNESNYRKGIKDGNNLELTHGLNGIRNTAKNKIQEIAGGRKDYKIDCLAAEFKDWEVSWKNKVCE